MNQPRKPIDQNNNSDFNTSLIQKKESTRMETHLINANQQISSQQKSGTMPNSSFTSIQLQEPSSRMKIS